jgi:hypothetical protein
MATQRRRFSPTRPPRVQNTRSNSDRALERDDLYMQLTRAGIDPQRAAAMVEKQLPYPDAAEETQPVRVPAGSSRIVGFFALLIGIPFYAEAARFTRDGWLAFVDWLCARIGIPWRVPSLDWRVALGLLILIAAAYSYVEMVKQPIRLPRNLKQDLFHFKLWKFERKWEVWVVWLVLIVSDVGTTYIGARQPDPSGLAIMRDIASASISLGVYAILLTFIPDRLIRFGLRALKGD